VVGGGGFPRLFWRKLVWVGGRNGIGSGGVPNSAAPLGRDGENPADSGLQNWKMEKNKPGHQLVRGRKHRPRRVDAKRLVWGPGGTHRLVGGWGRWAKRGFFAPPKMELGGDQKNSPKSGSGEVNGQEGHLLPQKRRKTTSSKKQKRGRLSTPKKISRREWAGGTAIVCGGRRVLQFSFGTKTRPRSGRAPLFPRP